MTEKLYYNDAYLNEFSATVISVSEKDGQYLTVLDKTAFFPTEGGQSCDSGTINGHEVLDVFENGGVIYHLLDKPLDADLAAFGEVGLAGEVRTANRAAQRVSEAYRLGFRKIVLPAQNADAINLDNYPDLKLIAVRNVRELRSIFR